MLFGLFRALLPTLILAIFALNAHAANSGVTYQGRILRPDGSPLTGAAVQFKLQVRTPDGSDCLMYEESKAALDMRNSNGTFSVTMNDGTGARTSLLIADGAAAATTIPVDRIFANRGAFTFDPSTCTSTNTYAPNPSDGRNLVVLFKDETMSAWEPIPAQKINFVPFAFEAKQIAGFTPMSLVRVAELDGTLGSVSPISNFEYTKLLSLAQTTVASGQVVGWNGSSWTSVDPQAGIQAFAKAALPTCAANNFLRNNGSGAFECIAPAVGGGGTVTQVNTGTGLTGGGFTTTGTISISAGGVTATELANNAVITAKIADGSVTDVKLATDAVTNLKIINGAVDSSKLAADSVTSAKIVDGTITGADLANNISVNTSGTLSSRGLTVYPNPTGSFGVSFAAPAGLSANYVLTWPLAQSTGAQVLQNDGSGVLSWTSLSNAGMTSLTGDVTGAGSGAVATTIAANAVTTAKIANANVTLAKLSADSVDSTKIVDGSIATADLAAASVTYAKLQNISANNRLLGRATTGSGVTEEITLGPGLSITGTTLNNTVTDTDTFAAVTAACANTFVPYKSGGAWTCLQATDTNVNSTLVSRDASGNFAANIATVNGLALKNAGSLLNLVNPVGGAWTMTLPATPGLASQVLTTDGSGVTSWTTPATGTYSQWTTQAPGINYMGGNVGIGTTSASAPLTVFNPVIGTSIRASGPGSQAVRIESTDLSGTSQSTVIFQTPAGTSLIGNVGNDGRMMNSSVAGEMIVSNRSGPLVLSADNAFTRKDIYISTAGNVGIGSTSPVARLHTIGGSTSSTHNSSTYTGGGSGNPGYGWQYANEPGAGGGSGGGGTAGGVFIGGTNSDNVAGAGAGIYAAGGSVGAVNNYGYGGAGIYAKGGANGTNTGGGFAPAGYFDGTLIATGNVGFGMAAPTASLQIKAGSASAATAPLKFTAGPVMTTPENGAVEYDGTTLFLTTGGIRRVIPSTTSSNDFSNVGSITGTGALTVAAGGTNQNLTLSGTGSGSVTTPSQFNVTNTTASTSTTTGAAIVSGGLGVAGNVNAGGAVSAVSGYIPQLYGSKASAGDLRLDGTDHATKGNVLLATAGGNVGIGTTSPSNSLSIQKDQNAATIASVTNISAGASSSAAFQAMNGTKTAAFGVYGTGAASYGALSANDSYAYGNGNLALMSDSGVIKFAAGGNAERVRIDTGGNVGIGTTAPISKLQSSGTLTVGPGTDPSSYGMLQMTTGGGSPTSNRLVFGSTGGWGFAISGNNSGTVTDYLTINASGVVTTSLGNSTIEGMPMSSSSPNHYMDYSSGGWNLNFGPTASPKVTFLGGGNVGIGNTVPTAKLHITAGPGAAGTAPLKLTSGTLMPTPEDGAVEYASSNLYYTIGSTRYVIPMNTAAGNYSNVSSIGNTTGSITMTPMSGNSVVVNSTTVSTSPTTGALIVSGGTGISGALNVSGNINSVGSLKAGEAGIGSFTSGGAGYSNFVYNAHSDTFVGTNLYLDNSRNLKIANTHTSMSGAGMVTWGNGATRQNAIDFWTTPAASVTAGNTYLPTAPRMTITSDGNVGVGTVTPQATLDVSGPCVTCTGPDSYANASSSDSGVLIKGYYTGASNSYMRYGDIAVKGGNVGSALRILTQNGGTTPQERVRVDGTGNVGIGTTSPTAKLDVVGSGRFYSSAADTALEVGRLGDGIYYNSLKVNSGYHTTLPSFQISQDSVQGSTLATNLGQMQFLVNGSSKLIVLNSGNVGIGTTAPTSTLDVNGAISSNDKIYVTKPGYVPSYITMTGNAPDNGNFEVWTRHGSYSKNLDITQNHFIINGAGQGNVGIGTTAPSTKLDIRGTGVVAMKIAATSNVMQLGANDGDGNHAIGWMGVNTTVTGVGSFGITTPSLIDSSRSGWALTGQGTHSAYEGSQDSFTLKYVRTNGTVFTPLYVTGLSGNVGIGTTAPSQILDVVGNIKTSGCLYYASSSLGSCASDARIKKDVHAFDLGLDTLLGLKPVKFKYNGLAGFKTGGEEQLGVIAQDVEKIAPSLIKKQMVTLHEGDKEKTEIKGVDYGAFAYVTINAVKELYAKWFADSQSLHREIASVNTRTESALAAKDREIKALKAALKLETDAKDKEIAKLKAHVEDFDRRFEKLEKQLKK